MFAAFVSIKLVAVSCNGCRIVLILATRVNPTGLPGIEGYKTGLVVGVRAVASASAGISTSVKGLGEGSCRIGD